METKQDILIIGGGVIGVCSAYYLTRAGLQVTLIERGEIASGSSYGNAGLIVPSHSTPLAAPGVLSQGLKWLMNPESPFYIKPRVEPDFINWLWRFRSFCKPEPYRQAVPLLRDLQRASLELYRELIAREALECNFEQSGGLVLFKTEQGLEKSMNEVRLMQENGLNIEVLGPESVRDLEPAVQPDLSGGLIYHEDGHLNPALFVQNLAERCRELGAVIRTDTEVIGFETSGQTVTSVRTTQGDFQVEQIVLTAGAWSSQVARDLDLKLSLQPAKGYSITVKRVGDSPRIPLHLGEAKVAVTPMGSLLRFAGTLELAGFDQTINQRRVKAIRRAATEYLVGFDQPDIVEIWQGFRPCPPDGLPYIGRTRRLDNLIVATGHSYLGLSMGPITGTLVKQLICEEKPAVALDALQVDRFAS